MFNIEENRLLLEKVLAEFQLEFNVYYKMYMYYLGLNHKGDIYNFTNVENDFINDMSLIDNDKELNDINNRTRNKINTNFIKKFIKEEVSYSLGNDVNYISHSGSEDIIDSLKYNMAHWVEDHDANLMKNMLIFSHSYELYYIDKNAKFCSRIISPLFGYALTDEYNDVVFFIHIFKKKFDSENKLYIDIYTDTEIIHCDETFKEVSQRNTHLFGRVPVSIAQLSEEGWLDTVYKDICGLQDSYQQNLGDISEEITEFRNAYLAFKNAQIDDADIPDIKKKGILQFKGEGTAEWLIKSINDNFIQNTLNTIEDKMYQLSSHINNNEKMQSNLSGIALRSRLISLEEKCKLNQKAFANCVKTRLQMLFTYINSLKNTSYDYLDVKLKLTPNIPSDDLINAQIISTLGDKITLETGLSLLGFIDNPTLEAKKVLEERKSTVNSLNSDDKSNSNDEKE